MRNKKILIVSLIFIFGFFGFSETISAQITAPPCIDDSYCTYLTTPCIDFYYTSCGPGGTGPAVWTAPGEGWVPDPCLAGTQQNRSGFCNNTCIQQGTNTVGKCIDGGCVGVDNQYCEWVGSWCPLSETRDCVASVCNDNGVCDTGAGETNYNCPADCPSGGGNPVCGNNLCEVGETCSSCSVDCGSCGLFVPTITDKNVNHRRTDNQVFQITSSNYSVGYLISYWNDSAGATSTLWTPMQQDTSPGCVEQGNCEPDINGYTGGVGINNYFGLSWNTSGIKTFQARAEDQSGQKSAWAYHQIEIVNALLPDLTTGPVFATQAIVGQPVTFSARITNSGYAGTGAGFTNLFQTASSSSGANITDYPVSGMSALAMNGWATTSKSITFPSSGIIYVRICADKSSTASAGSIPELNENNNCNTGGASAGGWTPITINPAPIPVINLFNADPNPITLPDHSTTLAWSATNNPTCTASANPGNAGWNGSKSASGSQPVTLPSVVKTYNFTLKCANYYGEDTKTIPVNIVAAVPLQQTLRVNKTGQGTATTSPAGINCGTGCTFKEANFNNNSNVTVYATPNKGMMAVWGTTGACAGKALRAPSCTFNMGVSSKTVNVIFIVDPNYNEKEF